MCFEIGMNNTIVVSCYALFIVPKDRKSFLLEYQSAYMNFVSCRKITLHFNHILLHILYDNPQNTNFQFENL